MANKPSLDDLYTGSANKPSLDDLYSGNVGSPTNALPALKPGMIDMRSEGLSNMGNPVQLANQGLLKTTTGQGFDDRMTNMIPAPNAQTPIPQMLLQNAGRAALGTVGSGLDMITSPVGLLTGLHDPVVSGAGEAAGRVDNWLVKLPQKAFRYGKDPLNVMKDEAVTGNSITDLAQNYEARLNQRTQELKAAVANSPAQLNLTVPVNKAIASLTDKSANSLTDSSALQDQIKTLNANIAKQYPDLNNLSLSRAVDLKRQLADEFPFSPTGTLAQNAIAKAAHQLHHQINDAIDANAPDVGALNDKVSSLIDISQAAQNRMSVEARNNPFGLIGSLVGGGEAMAGHPIEGLGTALAMKAASSPAVLSRVAWGLSKLSTADKLNLFQKAPWFQPIAGKAMMVRGQPLTGEYIPPSTKLPSPPLGLTNKNIPGDGFNMTDSPNFGNLIRQSARKN